MTDRQNDADRLIRSLEDAFGMTLPERWATLLRTDEGKRPPRVRFAGYIRGPYDLDFSDPELADVEELAMSAGITDFEDAAWDDDFADFAPLASLSHPEVEEPGMFLVVRTTDDALPVYLFDQESGFKLFPLAPSLDAFLTGLPDVKTDISASFRPGDAASASDEDEADDDEADDGGSGDDDELSDPAQAKAYAGALSKFNRGDRAGALAELEALAKIAGDHPAMLRALSTVHLAMNAPDKALPFAAAWRARLPRACQPTLMEARVLLLLGRLDDGMALAKRAAELAGDDESDRAHALALEGFGAFKKGDHERAKEALTEAVELDDFVGDDYPFLEEALGELGVGEEAEDE